MKVSKNMGILGELKVRWRQGLFHDCLNLLSRQDRIKVSYVFFAQIILSLLDLAGIVLIGVLGALSVNGIQSTAPDDRTQAVLESFHLENTSLQWQVAILGVTAGGFLLFRTIASMFLIRRTINFLSNRSALISSNLISELLSQPFIKIQARPQQETVYACTIGVSTIVLGVLATSVNVLSDLVLASVVTFGLLIIDPTVAVSTLVFFSILAITLYQKMQTRSSQLGIDEASLNISTNKKLVEVLNLYRESTVRNTRWRYSDEISSLRLKLSKIQAEITFMPNISKYVLETGIVVGAVLLSAFQFSTQDSVGAIASLGIFIVSSSRLAPALLRIQQGAIHIRNSIGVATPTLKLIREISSVIDVEKSSPDFQYFDFVPSVTLRGVTVQFENRIESALFEIDLEILPGEYVAIVGPSGAGKTTLVDVILGTISPNNGQVLVSNFEPGEVARRWPGAVGYVPQEVFVIDGSVIDNVSAGIQLIEGQVKLVNWALAQAQLSELISELSDGIETQLGVDGVNLSGGQKQRLGIARALFTQPKLLVLDEATSALDADTENRISRSIQDLRGSHTIVVIAHRLSTVRDADRVVYLDQGRVLAQGTFSDVRNQIPAFDLQANLMGL